jgi:hypothetical protein
MILDARGRPARATGGKSVADLIRRLRKELGRMPNKHKALTLESIAALTDISLQLHQAKQPRPVVISPAGD